MKIKIKSKNEKIVELIKLKKMKIKFTMNKYLNLIFIMKSKYIFEYKNKKKLEGNK